MEEFENFDAIFESEERLVFHKSDMKRNRSTLEDLLFVDRLLRAIGIPNRGSMLVLVEKFVD